MNKSSLAMGALILPLCIASSCKEGGGKEEKVIEKPEINIVDGHMTPEVLEALGQVNGAVASPDGKTIAFTIKYEDIKENKGNSEIYTVPAEGGEVTRRCCSCFPYAPPRMCCLLPASCFLWFLCCGSQGNRNAFLRRKSSGPVLC